MRAASLCLLLAACSGGGAPAPAGADLSGFRVESLPVGAATFEAWIAETPAQRAQGLMNATMEQVAPLPDGTPRGMLFVFAGDVVLNFWMRDTYIPLDLAYADASGTIREVHDLFPLDETPVTSSAPMRYALEAPAGTFAAHGIGVGSVIVVP
jgi:uncharacterized membrane protein (UPF0127 family)